MKSSFYVLRCQLKCLCLPSSYSTSVARVVNSSVPSSSNDRFMNDNRINSMREDESLVLMGDFVGVKPSSLTMANKKQKDSVIVIAKLQDEIYSNHRLKANTFVTSVLQPLERKLEPFCTTLNNSSDLYAPIVIKMCGEMMTDVPIQNRMAILNRLIKAMTKLGLKLSVDGINAMIKVWIDNQHRFDVFKLMNFVEKNLQLSLNTQFFSLCAWELARQGDLQKLASWGDEARSRCLKPEIDIELAAIFCSENNGFIQHSEHLMQSFLTKHISKDNAVEENFNKAVVLSAAIQGAAWSSKIDRVQQLLSKSVIELEKPLSTPTIGFLEEKIHLLSLSQDVVFEIIWLLASKHSVNHGKEFVCFTTRVLSQARRNEGFFKLLFSQAERHLIHQLYYTAIAIIADTNRIRGYLQQQSRNVYLRHALAKLANQLLRNNVPIQKIMEISNEVVSTFGERIRFYDELMYSILTYRYSTSEQRFEQFRAFVDLHDLKRERLNVILPLIARADSLISRCKLIYILSSMGYKRFFELDARVMHKHVYWPLLQSIATKRSVSDPWDLVDEMVLHLKSFGISESELWRMCYMLLKDLDNDRFYDSTQLKKLEAWLRANVYLLKKEDVLVENESVSLNPLQGKVSVADVLSTLRNEFRKHCDIDNLIDTAYELKRRYPNVAIGQDIRYDSLDASTRLFSTITESQLSKEGVEKIIQALITLIKLDFVRLPTMEMITCNIVYRVLCDLGWTMGVETWMRFQSCFQCSNAILELLNFAIRKKFEQKDQESRVNYVFHKANNFMSPLRAKAIYASVLLNSLRTEESANYLKECDPKVEYQDFQYAFQLMTTRNSKLGLTRMSTEFPLVFGELAFIYAKQQRSFNQKMLFARKLLFYSNKNDYGILTLDLCDLFKRHGVSVVRTEVNESRRTVYALRQSLLKWTLANETRMLNQENAKKILKTKIAEINRRMAAIGK